MNSKELIEKRIGELALTLQSQFHPELMMGIICDTEAWSIARQINALVEAHCLALLMNSIKTDALRVTHSAGGSDV